MANADVLRRERKSRAMQKENHELRAWGGQGNDTEREPTRCAQCQEAAAHEDALCAVGAERVTSQVGYFERG